MFSKSSLLILEQPLLWLVLTFKKLESVKDRKKLCLEYLFKMPRKSKVSFTCKTNKFCTTASTKIHTVLHSSSLQSQYMPQNVVSSAS